LRGLQNSKQHTSLQTGTLSYSAGKDSHWTQASSTEPHWLDRRLPGAREWLENKNRDLWLKGIGERCRQYPSLNGREGFIKEHVDARYKAFMERYAHLATADGRSQTHLQMGCLMMATKQVLLPWIKDTQTIEKIVDAHMGDFTSPVLRFVLRYVCYLYRDPYKSIVRRLNGLRLDYGSSFGGSIVEAEGGRRTELHIKECIYEKLFEAEECEHLLACCCCSRDSKDWFQNLQPHGVGFERSQWKGAGDATCCLCVSKISKS